MRILFFEIFSLSRFLFSLEFSFRKIYYPNIMVDVKIPSPGESITEVVISRWLAEDGSFVEKDQAIAEIDSDKATLELTAELAGRIRIITGEGETVPVGAVVGQIDNSVKGEGKKGEAKKSAETSNADERKSDEKNPSVVGRSVASNLKASPVAKAIIEQNGIKAEKMKGSGAGGKITKADVEAFISTGSYVSSGAYKSGMRNEERKKMSPLRKKLSQRLVAVKNQTAMLTTFNEVDMSAVMGLRAKFKEKFKEKHGVGLGFMSFFTRAVTHSLKLFPQVNAAIDGDEIIFYDYADVGIAVSAPKGLMVPVLRNAEKMSFAEIEINISELATRAREGKITIEEMTGGTFTISNGGIFGSMLSTPILNPPQSAILGMHNIVDRPVAINGKVEIRPVMFVALSYDHRVIDGKESVGFLLKIKEMLENPEVLFEAGNPEKELL